MCRELVIHPLANAGKEMLGIIWKGVFRWHQIAGQSLAVHSKQNASAIHQFLNGIPAKKRM